MPAKPITPLIQRYTLDRTDKILGCEGEPSYVDFRQATQGDYTQRAMVFSEVTRVVKDEDDRSGEILYRQRWNPDELAMEEVFLTIADCNLLDPYNTDQPLFRFKKVGTKSVLDMSRDEFRKAWGSLQPFTATEIYEKCRALNRWDGEEGKKA